MPDFIRRRRDRLRKQTAPVEELPWGWLGHPHSADFYRDRIADQINEQLTSPLSEAPHVLTWYINGSEFEGTLSEAFQFALNKAIRLSTVAPWYRSRIRLKR